MASMFDWVRYNRPDVNFLKGPKEDGSYNWNEGLENPEEILNLIQSFDPSWSPPPVVPQTITPRQVRLALIGAGFALSSIDTFIQSLPEPTKSMAFVWWEYSLEFQRDNALMNALAPQLGLSQTQLDELFILGEKL